MIPFAQPSIELNREDIYNIGKITKSSQFCLGKYTERLEDYFIKTTGVRFAIACNSATMGLTIAFKSADIRDKMIAIPSFTWPSIKYALDSTHNYPIWCDIDKDTWLLQDIPKLAHIENVPVGAISPVDTFGNEVEISEKIDAPLIIDAAHSFGNPNLGKRGLIEVVSFSFTKPVTGGQGGIILTNDKNIYRKAKELVKLSAKITEINAYLILKEIGLYDSKVIVRNNIITMYRELIKIPFVEQKIETASNLSTYSILFESTEIRDRVAESFIKNDIEVKMYYTPLTEELPNADYIYSKILALPVYKSMISKIDKICKLINEA